MKKIKGLGAMLLAGFLVIPGNLWLASQVLAQSDLKTITEWPTARSGGPSCPSALSATLPYG